MSLSRIIHHSHSFTRLEIYHHIYLMADLILLLKDIFGPPNTNNTFIYFCSAVEVCEDLFGEKFPIFLTIYFQIFFLGSLGLPNRYSTKTNHRVSLFLTYFSGESI